MKSEDLELKHGETQLQNIISTLSSRLTIVFRGQVHTRQAMARFLMLTQHPFISIFLNEKVVFCYDSQKLALVISNSVPKPLMLQS